MTDLHDSRPGWPLVAAGTCLVLLAAAVVTWTYDVTEITSTAMAPSVPQGDRAFVQPVEPDEVRRGDVVLFDPPWPRYEGAPPFVFRVVAVGGDHVQCCDPDGRLLVNGTALDEDYLDDAAAQPAPFEVDVPAEHVFVAGDARASANDSRAHLEDDSGAVPVDAVRGRLVATAWPPWHWGVQDAQLLGFADRDPSGGHAYPYPYVAVLVAGLTGLVLVLAGLLRWGARLRARRRWAGSIPT